MSHLCSGSLETTCMVIIARRDQQHIFQDSFFYFVDRPGMTAKRMADLLVRTRHKVVGAAGRYDRPDTLEHQNVNEPAVTVFFFHSLSLSRSLSPPCNSRIIRGHFDYQMRQPGAVSQNNDRLLIKDISYRNTQTHIFNAWSSFFR